MSLPSLWPTLRARNCDALIDFYERAFGFSVVLRVHDGEHIAHGELTTPWGSGLMVGDAREGTAWSLEPGSAGTYVVVNSVDDLHRLATRAGDAGATLIAPIHESPPGHFQLTLADIEGNLWAFGTYPGTAP